VADCDQPQRELYIKTTFSLVVRRLGVDAQLLIQNPTLLLQCRGITELDYLPSNYLPMAVK